MSCPRCQGLMVPIRFVEDAASATGCVSGWQCLLCGEVTDPGIKANRKWRPQPTRNRARPQGSVPRRVGGPKRKGY